MLEVTRNRSFGQLYVEDDEGNHLRIPRRQVDAFLKASAATSMDIQDLYQGYKVLLPVSFAVAQQFEG